MTTETTTAATSAGNLNGITELGFAAADYAAKARSAVTSAAYARDWAHFADWANSHRLDPLPASPDTAAAYLAALSGCR